jgi:hypothetical protein
MLPVLAHPASAIIKTPTKKNIRMTYTPHPLKETLIVLVKNNQCNNITTLCVYAKSG